MASQPGGVDRILKTTTTNAILGGLSAAAFITKATVVNLTSSNRTVTVYRGTATTTNNMIVNAQTVSGGQTFVLPLGGLALFIGQNLYIKCSATNSMNANISYVIPG